MLVENEPGVFVAGRFEIADEVVLALLFVAVVAQVVAVVVDDNVVAAILLFEHDFFVVDAVHLVEWLVIVVVPVDAALANVRNFDIETFDSLAHDFVLTLISEVAFDRRVLLHFAHQVPGEWHDDVLS